MSESEQKEPLVDSGVWFLDEIRFWVSCSRCGTRAILRVKNHISYYEYPGQIRCSRCDRVCLVERETPKED